MSAELLNEAVRSWQIYSQKLDAGKKILPDFYPEEMTIQAASEILHGSDMYYKAGMMLPFMDEASDSSVGYNSITNFLSVIQSMGSQLATLLQEYVCGNMGGDYSGAKTQAMELVTELDEKISYYGAGIHSQDMWSWQASTLNAVDMYSLWVDKEINAVSQLSKRRVPREDLRRCTPALSCTVMVRDDTLEGLQGRSMPCLMMPTGRWRADENTGNDACEAYMFDVAFHYHRLFKQIRSKLISADAKPFDKIIEEQRMGNPTSLANALTGHDSVKVMMERGGQVLEGIDALGRFMVTEGMFQPGDEWINLFKAEQQFVRRAISASNNPNAKFNIGGWS